MQSLAHTPIENFSVATLTVSYNDVKADHRHISSVKDCQRFVYIISGEACFTFENGQALRASSCDMVYLPLSTSYRSVWPKPSCFVVVNLLLKDGNGEPIHFGSAPSVLFQDSHQIYEGLLSELAKKVTVNGPYDWLERLSLTLKLLCEISRDTVRCELDEKNDRIQEGIQYLENNYAEDFSVDKLARICALSPSAFRRLFFACKGMSPIAYRNCLRIRKAAELLKNRRYTVGEAAELVGIHDVNYFGRLFRRYIGSTPREIKNGILNSEK